MCVITDSLNTVFNLKQNESIHSQTFTKRYVKKMPGYDPSKPEEIKQMQKGFPTASGIAEQHNHLNVQNAPSSVAGRGMKCNFWSTSPSSRSPYINRTVVLWKYV